MRRFVPALLCALMACSAPQVPDPPPEPQPTSLALAPREDCPMALMRGRGIPVDEIVEALHGHVPARIPRGFGFIQGSTGESGNGVTAWWSDGRCAQFRVTFSPEWGNAADWQVEYDTPRACGNAILGMKRCIGYRASALDGGVGVQTIGLSRAQADELVESIPL